MLDFFLIGFNHVPLAPQSTSQKRRRFCHWSSMEGHWFISSKVFHQGIWVSCYSCLLCDICSTHFCIEIIWWYGIQFHDDSMYRMMNHEHPGVDRAHLIQFHVKLSFLLGMWSLNVKLNTLFIVHVRFLHVKFIYVKLNTLDNTIWHLIITNSLFTYLV